MRGQSFLFKKKEPFFSIGAHWRRMGRHKTVDSNCSRFSRQMILSACLAQPTKNIGSIWSIRPRQKVFVATANMRLCAPEQSVFFFFFSEKKQRNNIKS